MNSPLYKLSEENFGTVYSYYDFIRKKSEKYYSFITKFNKATMEYCNNMKNLFTNEITEDKVDLNKDAKRKGSIKVNNDSNEKLMKGKNIDISIIEHNIEKLNKMFDNYFDCLNIFVGTLNSQSVTLNKNIENTKQAINNINDNYSNSKNTFEQKYNDFESLNKKMYSLYYDQEKNIIEFLIKKKLQTSKEKEKEKENELILKIFEALATQKDLKNNFIQLGNFGKVFNDSYNSNFNEMKEKTVEFYNKFEGVIKLICDFYKKSFLAKIQEFTSNMNINDAKIKGKDFKVILNQKLKNIEPKLSEIGFDLYKIASIKCNTKEENHLVDNQKSLINLIRNSNLKKIDDKEIYYIARKMNNFEYVDKKEYKIEIEKEKVKLHDKLLKLFNYVTQKSVKKNNDLNNENKLNNNNEIKDNVSEDDEIDNNEKKEDGLNQEELNYICKLMKKKEYRDYLLTKLNNHRAEGSLEMPENIYNIFVKIFLEIMKYLVEEKENGNI